MTTKKSTKPAASKKEFKKEIAVKIETVLAELKASLGEKEFHHRLKKATKVLTHGLFGNTAAVKETPVKPEKKAAAPKKIKSIRKGGAKKVSVKKATPKKATAK